MDRNKAMSNSRNQKKVSPLGNEFFALGTKSNRDDKSKTAQSQKSAGSTLERDRKRDAPLAICNTNKKPKLGLSRNEDSIELWEQMATDCEPAELIAMVFAAMDRDNGALPLLCGSAKNLIVSNLRLRPDSILYVALMYLAKKHPDLFCNEVVAAGLISVLRREANSKTRQCLHSHVVAANILGRSYNSKPKWPDAFLHVYVEDAINDRTWVDNDLCEIFVENIVSSFHTRIPVQVITHLDSGSAGTSSIQPHRDGLQGYEDDPGDNSFCFELNQGAHYESNPSLTFESKYIRSFDGEQTVEKYVVDIIKEQLNKRQQPDCYVRNLLKFLCAVSGVSEVRYLSIARLELWIHSGKLVKFAQQLLAYICFNVKSKCFKDHEVLAILVKMRLKTKPLINFYMTCLNKMIILQPDILSIILKLVVQNELSNTRNPNNMGMLATMFQTSPDQSAIHLAGIYKEFLLQREDCLRTLRVFLRELVRMLRFDINIAQFCKVLLNEQEHTKLIDHSEFKERIFHSMVDIICLCMLLCVSPQVRETCISLRTNRDVKGSSILIKFYTQVSQIHLDAVSWMYEIVPNLFKLKSTDYNQALHKILLLENAEQYSRFDQWPSEPERASLLRIVSETPVHEDTLLRIILIGITKDIPLTIPDSIDILILVIKRASAMRSVNIPAVQANKLDIIDFLFSMAEYHHPENIKLPTNYDPPKLAISVLYWKAWLIMLMISAHNPSTFGAFCWEHYPTMKMIIEMCITNQCNENIVTKEELQILQVERDQILEFESYLAAQTSQAIITEENAILISQLMLMDPMGPARRIPITVLDQLKYINKNLKLGHLLCRSRKPDLLLDIIQRQGTTQSMPWLSDLVQNSEGDFNHLPVQCLCEFLLFNAKNINEDNNRDAELINFLRNLIFEPYSSKQTVCEVLDYIFRRLSSTVKQSRTSALIGLRIIFKCPHSEENELLLKSIPRIPYFRDVCRFIIPQLRSACQVENSYKLVMSYIQFIAAYTLNDPVTDMLDHVIDMSQLIVERSTMFQHIIPPLGNTTNDLYETRLQTLKCLFVMFNNYIIKLQEHRETYEWTEYPDLLMVHFSDGMQLPIHLNIVHAFVILLTHSSNTISESVPILDYWLPCGNSFPIGYMPNLLHEPVQLLPDWLKLKMIRSQVDRLIEAALQELTPDQIVLFVQNFGTPVVSMSKLLALLDHAVTEQIEAVKSAILNKAYLAQLIEIQQARGAKNGHFTVQALGLRSHSQTVPDLPKICNDILESINFTNFEEQKIAVKCDTKESLEIVLIILKTAHLNAENYNSFRKAIHQMLDHNFNSIGLRHIRFNKTVVYLLQFIKSSNSLKLNEHIAKKNHICTLFRTLFKNNDNVSDNSNVLLLLSNEFSKLLPVSEQTSRTQHYYSLCLINLFESTKLHQISKRKLLGKDNVERNNISICSFSSRFLVYKQLESNSICDNGLLVDRLIAIDPELSSVCHQKLNYLFSDACSDFKFYLLSLICHQTNWETLIATIEYLLEFELDIDSTIALNFIEALINNPKLWQGRDKSVSKNNALETVFLLNKNELSMFTQLVLREEESKMNKIADKYDYNICAHINLLLRLTNKNSSDLVKFVDNVCHSACSLTIKLKALQQIYLLYPSIKFIRCIQMEKYSGKLQTLQGCRADKMTNYLITCLGNLFLRKDFESLSSDIELLIRKLAASHPTLFLRQLGVLSTLIQGKAQISLRVLRDENQCQRFIQTIRILEILQPMLFDDAYKQEFQASLSCYFKFFKQHYYIKEIYHIFIKFVHLLQSYVNVNPTSALLFIEQYVRILLELAEHFPTLAPLHKFVQGITLLQYSTMPCGELNAVEFKQEFDLDELVDTKVMSNTVTDVEMFEIGSNLSTAHIDINNKGIIPFTILSSYSKLSTVSSHFLNLIKLVKHSNSEDIILNPLQEIESFTSKRFAFINELFDRLLELIFSPSAQIRSNAFILLIRHLKHNPGRLDLNRCTLNAYIQCLRDDNSSVATTAIDNLSEITLLLQEHAVEILTVAFSLGIKSRVNTSIQIKRVLQTLMLQHGH